MKIDAQPCRRDEGRSIVPLVPPQTDSTQDQDAYSDPSTRAISVTDVENSFVESVYDKIAAVYDWTMGPTLHLAIESDQAAQDSTWRKSPRSWRGYGHKRVSLSSGLLRNWNRFFE